MNNLYFAPLDQITFGDVLEFCKLGHRENRRLEYKEDFSGKDRAKQIAKTLCAFANSDGGLFILGVREDKDSRKPHDQPNGADLGDKPRDAVLTACAQHVFPPMNPEISEFLANPDNPSLGFLVMRIQPSRDVHTVEDGTGIYVRTGDHSEHVRATYPMIEHLSAKRKHLVDIQEQRCVNAVSRLKSGAGEWTKQGTLWITIGPEMIYDPLIELRELSQVAAACKARSKEFNREIPFQSDYDTRSITDGLYEIDDKKRVAGLLDRFGNIVFSTRMSRPIKASSFSIFDDEEKWKRAIFSSVDGPSVNATHSSGIAELMSAAIDCAQKLYVEKGCAGLIALRFRFSGIRDTVMFESTHPGSGPLCHAHLDDEIEVAETLPVSELRDEGDSVVFRLLDRLLWNWGCKDTENVTPYVFENFEMSKHGKDDCECKRGKKPKNQAKCFQCRKSDS